MDIAIGTDETDLLKASLLLGWFSVVWRRMGIIKKLSNGSAKCLEDFSFRQDAFKESFANHR